MSIIYVKYLHSRTYFVNFKKVDKIYKSLRAMKTTSHLNTSSEQYQQNVHNMLALNDMLSSYQKKALYQGTEKRKAAQLKSKGLLARDRIELLLDQDSFFLELLPFVGLESDELNAGGTTISGIGCISGRLCMVNSNIGTLKGGTIDLITLNKLKRIYAIAKQNGLPMINFVESGGANLSEQDQVFIQGGGLFRSLSKSSKRGIPSISIVVGKATAGGAYIPGLSDYAIFVDKKAQAYLGGPPLVEMATGEKSSGEELGGAQMHSTFSGVSDYWAVSEEAAIAYSRQLVAQFKLSKAMPPHHVHYKEPKFNIHELLGLIPTRLSSHFDITEVIYRIVDDSKFTPFKPNYGTSLITGWSSIAGYRIGILANNGILNADAANKGAHFIQLCNQSNHPLLFLQHTTGFSIGKKQERDGIIKHGAKLINAVSNSQTPAVTLLVGASYGAGNYAMNGRAYKPRFLFSYPNAKTAVMGGVQLGGVLELIQRENALKNKYDIDEDQLKAMKDSLVQTLEKKSTSWYATSNQWDDGIVNPLETRNYLKLIMRIIHNKTFKASSKYGVFRM